VETLISFLFGEEWFWRQDPKKVIKEHCSEYKHLWEYTSTTQEEEEVHCCAMTYDELSLRER
jgi:hypothetical protein